MAKKSCRRGGRSREKVNKGSYFEKLTNNRKDKRAECLQIIGQLFGKIKCKQIIMNYTHLRHRSDLHKLKKNRQKYI